MSWAEPFYSLFFLAAVWLLVVSAVYLARTSSYLIMRRRTLVRKVRSLWPDPAQAERALAELDRYSGDRGMGRARIQLAILKISNGNLEELRRWVDIALGDYRDPLLLAEYPEEAEAPFEGLNPSPEDRRRMEEIRSRDREQYLRWLRS